MRIGIFFGGPSREREISYLGGKTAFENIDQNLFEPVLVFVDSLGRFILVNETVLYHEGIRSFYPPQKYQKDDFSVYIESLQNTLSESELEQIMTEIGTPILPQNFHKHFDFAFIIVHGPDCEDGAIQGLLEWHKMPYMGPGLMGSAVSIDKILQNEQIARANGQEKKMAVVRWENWSKQDKKQLFETAKESVGLPIVIKAPHQGSSIGVSIVKEDSLSAFEKAMNQCFFAMEVNAEDWQNMSDDDKHTFAQKVANLDEGIGYPLAINKEKELITHPTELIEKLNTYLSATKTPPSGGRGASLLSANAEDQVLLEEFINGQEFSCGVIQDDDGTVIALPPTEIVQADSEQTFDFKTKYKTGTTTKKIPVQTSLENNINIQHSVELVFEKLGMCVVTRIDGFLTADDRVLLHDPNTLPGMSPASLIFKQMAEIGLSITQSLTYFIRQSLRERIRTGKSTVYLRQLLEELDTEIAQNLPQNADTISSEPNHELIMMTREKAKNIMARFGAKV